MKASNCYKENGALFHAAKSLDQSVILCKESGSPKEIQKLAEDACYLYQQHGSLDSGASVLDKAAKIVEHHNPEIALQLYQRAADVVMVCFVFILQSTFDIWSYYFHNSTSR